MIHKNPANTSGGNCIYTYAKRTYFENTDNRRNSLRIKIIFDEWTTM